jgi:hypothetical protein
MPLVQVKNSLGEGLHPGGRVLGSLPECDPVMWDISLEEGVYIILDVASEKTLAA